jgi:hypothetical protein
MTIDEYKSMSNNSKLKYRNQKTIVDGIIFDSKKEADYYMQLKILKQNGNIIDFLRQVPFLLHEYYFSPTDGPVRPIYYIADFVVIKRDPNKFVKLEIHEVKGKWTKEAIFKRKMFQRKYLEYEFKII